MDTITIVNHEMTSEEFDRSKLGFDEYTLESDVKIQDSERVSYVALRQERFVGCSSGLAYKNGNEYSGWFYLTDLFVEKDHRFQGIGSELLAELERKIMSIGIKDIWTWTAGYEAPEFYIKQGYEIFAEMENWYSNGSSRFGLRKKLKG